MFKFIEAALNHPRTVRFFTAVTPGSAELVERPNVELNMTNILAEGEVSRNAVLERKFYKVIRKLPVAPDQVAPVAQAQAQAQAQASASVDSEEKGQAPKRKKPCTETDRLLEGQPRLKRR